VDTIFCEVYASLRSKDVRTLLLASTMLNVVVERTTRLWEAESQDALSEAVPCFYIDGQTPPCVC